MTDVGSTKLEIAELAEQLFGGWSRASFLPGHPMAGKESGGALLAEAGVVRRSDVAVYANAAGDDGDGEGVARMGRVFWVAHAGYGRGSGMMSCARG